MELLFLIFATYQTLLQPCQDSISISGSLLIFMFLLPTATAEVLLREHPLDSQSLLGPQAQQLQVPRNFLYHEAALSQ
jgi:hypothetical protein